MFLMNHNDLKNTIFRAQKIVPVYLWASWREFKLKYTLNMRSVLFPISYIVG